MSTLLKLSAVETYIGGSRILRVVSEPLAQYGLFGGNGQGVQHESMGTQAGFARSFIIRTLSAVGNFRLVG